jgi:CRISPR-associated exonuclease Cas4
LFYGETRRRKAVPFDEILRALTLEVIQAIRALLESRRTPSAEYQPRRCDACSLIELCQPHLLGRKSAVNAWLAKQLKE